MKKIEKKEKLQSRREFFKKAAKGSLPFIAAMALFGAPAILRASETLPMGCSGTCYGGCKNACTSCSTTCQGGCRNACTSCSTTCSGTCSNSCLGTCKWSSK